MPDWLGPMVAAPFVGSLLGVLIRRLPAGGDVVWSRSACEACGRRLAAAELVPVVSFLALRGRCRTCAAPIAPMHLLVELAAVAVAVWAASLGGGPALLWAGCGLGWTLLALAWIDWEHWLLPDALTLPLVVAGLGATAWLDPDALAGHAVGAAAGFALLRLVGAAYRRWRAREGLGGGDAKLLAAGGAWLGWQALSWVLLAAALAGLAMALLLRLRGRTVSATTAIPFGPPLALAIWLAWLYGG